jgi:hypothetical protein
VCCEGGEAERGGGAEPGRLHAFSARRHHTATQPTRCPAPASYR